MARARRRSRRTARRRFAAVLGCALATATACGPGEEETPTWVRVTVRFQDDLHVEQLRFTLLEGHQLLDLPAIMPVPPRSLDPRGETLDIYFDDSDAGQTLSLRVDGLLEVWRDDVRETEVVGSVRAEVVPREHERIGVELTLGDPALCGNGTLEWWVEDCDDRAQQDGDGCTSFCVVEPGFRCDVAGEPCVPE